MPCNKLFSLLLSFSSFSMLIASFHLFNIIVITIQKMANFDKWEDGLLKWYEEGRKDHIQKYVKGRKGIGEMDDDEKLGHQPSTRKILCMYFAHTHFNLLFVLVYIAHITYDCYFTKRDGCSHEIKFWSSGFS